MGKVTHSENKLTHWPRLLCGKHTQYVGVRPSKLEKDRDRRCGGHAPWRGWFRRGGEEGEKERIIEVGAGQRHEAEGLFTTAAAEAQQGGGGD